MCKTSTGENLKGQRGAALVTVIMVSLLLITASVAMLTAVGANSKNTTDVLSETKAYYAAESGIQATINVLRNNGTVDYKDAIDGTTLPATLYNWPSTGTKQRAVIDGSSASYSAYSLTVTDPDQGTPISYTSVGSFDSGGQIVDSGSRICVPDCAASPRTEVTIGSRSGSLTAFPSISQLGIFTVVNNGVAIPNNATAIKFRIEYAVSSNPRSGTKTIFGTITQPVANTSLAVSFQTQHYALMGSTIQLCSTNDCVSSSFPLNVSGTPTTVYANITAFEPYRLKVVSTGYGPNGALKNLEAIVRRNIFDGLETGAVFSMLGTMNPPAGSLPFLWDPGTSNLTYSGGNCAVPPGCVPTFGTTDPAILAQMMLNLPNNISPLPALFGNNSLPSWQQSPAALDAVVDQFRTAAQRAGRYFTNGTEMTNTGDFATGTGITFCEGSCTTKQNLSGGGTLIVTGMLTSKGGFNFKGLIIVTGEEGWDRAGGGNGQIIGSVVIAPYNKRNYVPENLSATFLAPRYKITGGGTSDAAYADSTSSIDNTSGISDFVAGVAEK